MFKARLIIVAASVAGLLLATIQARSDDLKSSGTACAVLQDNAQRLVCYDLQFRVEVTSPVVEGSGAWTNSTEKSKIDDSTEVFLSVDSDQPVSSRFGAQGRATLMVRCQKHVTALTIYFGGAFMADSGGYGQVVYRIDKKAAVTSNFSASTSNQHLGLWAGGGAIPVIKSLFGAQHLLVEATPYNENSVTLDFAVAGLESAIRPLREACKW